MTTGYEMNPEEDIVLYGDELREGMLVLQEYPVYRCSRDDTDRRQRFRRVLRPRTDDGQVCFIGEWEDGHQEVHAYGKSIGWLVKKASIPQRRPRRDLLAGHLPAAVPVLVPE
jgi:hypothetical protein